MSQVEALVIIHDKRVFAVLEVRALDGLSLSYDDAIGVRDCLMIKDNKRHERSAAQYQVLPILPVADGVRVIWGGFSREQNGHPHDLDISYDFELRGASAPDAKQILTASGGHRIWPDSVVLNAVH